jgi:L-ascorbate metabolism protein UlaG (beta-lactamase superfamily)
VNSLVLAIIGLRAVALSLFLAGDTKSSERLYLLADLVEAGKATDEHMSAVAEKLRSRTITDADWDELFQRIEADRERLHSD